MKTPARLALILVPAGLVLIALASMLPPVRIRLEIWYSELQYALNPPEEAIFIPGESLQAINLAVTMTLEAYQPTETNTPTPEIIVTPTATLSGPSPTPTQTPLPTSTPTPLPDSALIPDVKFITQVGLWNYCGPANLAMALTFWGWETTREEVGSVLRGGTPNERKDDKNVMPYEMANYVNSQTNLGMIVRMGGNLTLVKQLVAAGFPVILEKDTVLKDIGWVGHYLFVHGYDDAAQEVISNDTYEGEGTRYGYEQLVDSWQAFNYTFLIAYPPEREDELFELLGPFSDNTWSIQHALEIAQAETGTETGIGAYHAWFNVGTSYVNLFDYGPASVAYDTAFSIYADIVGDLPNLEKPWRMMWYQTGPYFAYYYTGRFNDVINLATTTLDAMNVPILEESFYWRALAREATGDYGGALSDMQTAVDLNPNFGPGITELRRMTGG